MNFSCPGCGAEMSIDVLIANEGAREAVLAALQLPAPLGKLLVQYVAMFRPGKRQLSWSRVGVLLEELRAPIAAAQYERHGRTWPAPLEYWRAGLENMVLLRDQGKLQLPLKSHGYLLEVIAGMSEKAEAKAETAHEGRRRGHAGEKPLSHTPAAPQPRGPATAVPEPLQKYVHKKAGDQ